MRELLSAGPVLAPGCYDAFSARLIEITGFRAAYLSGFSVEATQLGAPDLGILTLTELAQHAARVTSAVDIPVILDGEAGFGGVLNIRRAVRELERAGVAGMHIEDQVSPKRCPLLAGRQVVGREDALQRVKAACAARTDPDFVIIARTDADGLGVEEVIERCNRYIEAGADMVMPMLLDATEPGWGTLTPEAQMELMRSVAAHVDGPVMGMGTIPAGYSFEHMGEAGISLVTTAATTLSVAANAIKEHLSGLHATGICPQPEGPFGDPMAILEAVHLAEYTDFEARCEGVS
ncbi:oxaloacetate decarboxylase [Streptomyces sp. NPDC058665]|uniref:isocitrate lyase/PEP mutase family protein n=1 Tax=Streptomyces sp. NPDC058665 TaxID=3346586 RepID=UPI0036553218